MAPWVRRGAPALLVAAALTFSPLLVSPCISAEKPGEEKKEVSAETKAQLLQDLDRQMEQRRSEIAREEEKLSAAKSALEAAKRELRQELDKLEALKKEIEGQIARREKVVSERMDTIAKVYKAMKPKEASAALQDMDNDMAVSILDRLPGNTVAKIFDTMPKERVRELTRRLEEGRSK